MSFLQRIDFDGYLTCDTRLNLLITKRMHNWVYTLIKFKLHQSILYVFICVLSWIDFSKMKLTIKKMLRTYTNSLFVKCALHYIISQTIIPFFGK